MVVWVGLADAVLAVHLRMSRFIPLAASSPGGRPWLAWVHLATVAVGAVSITIGFDCPLTTWEQSLRRRGGQRPYTNGFVDHYSAGSLPARIRVGGPDGLRDLHRRRVRARSRAAIERAARRPVARPRERA